MGFLSDFAAGASEAGATAFMEQFKSQVEQERQEALVRVQEASQNRTADYTEGIRQKGMKSDFEFKTSPEYVEAQSRAASGLITGTQEAEIGKKKALVQAELDTKNSKQNVEAAANALILSNTLQASKGNLKNIAALSSASESSATKAQAAATMWTLGQSKELAKYRDALGVAVKSGDKKAIDSAQDMFEAQSGTYLKSRQQDAAVATANAKETGVEITRLSTALEMASDTQKPALQQQLDFAKSAHDGFLAKAAELSGVKLETPSVGKAAPPVGTVISGMKFKGGDPNKKDNWEPVKTKSGSGLIGSDSPTSPMKPFKSEIVKSGWPLGV